MINYLLVNIAAAWAVDREFVYIEAGRDGRDGRAGGRDGTDGTGGPGQQPLQNIAKTVIFNYVLNNFRPIVWGSRSWGPGLRKLRHFGATSLPQATLPYLGLPYLGLPYPRLAYPTPG